MVFIFHVEEINVVNTEEKLFLNKLVWYIVKSVRAEK